MKSMILAIVIMMAVTLSVSAKPLGLNCDRLTDAECSCVSGYIVMAYYDIETAYHIKDKGMSALTWVLQKSMANCLEY